MSFESAAKSGKFHHCYITVKATKTTGIARATGLRMFSDETVFEVRIAELVSVLLE